MLKFCSKKLSLVALFVFTLNVSSPQKAEAQWAEIASYVTVGIAGLGGATILIKKLTDGINEFGSASRGLWLAARTNVFCCCRGCCQQELMDERDLNKSGQRYAPLIKNRLSTSPAEAATASSQWTMVHLIVSHLDRITMEPDASGDQRQQITLGGATPFMHCVYGGEDPTSAQRSRRYYRIDFPTSTDPVHPWTIRQLYETRPSRKQKIFSEELAQVRFAIDSLFSGDRAHESLREKLLQGHSGLVLSGKIISAERLAESGLLVRPARVETRDGVFEERRDLQDSRPMQTLQDIVRERLQSLSPSTQPARRPHRRFAFRPGGRSRSSPGPTAPIAAPGVSDGPQVFVFYVLEPWGSSPPLYTIGARFTIVTGLPNNMPLTALGNLGIPAIGAPSILRELEPQANAYVSASEYDIPLDRLPSLTALPPLFRDTSDGTSEGTIEAYPLQAPGPRYMAEEDLQLYLDRRLLPPGMHIGDIIQVQRRNGSIIDRTLPPYETAPEPLFPRRSRTVGDVEEAGFTTTVHYPNLSALAERRRLYAQATGTQRRDRAATTVGGDTDFREEYVLRLDPMLMRRIEADRIEAARSAAFTDTMQAVAGDDGDIGADFVPFDAAAERRSLSDAGSVHSAPPPQGTGVEHVAVDMTGVDAMRTAPPEILHSHSSHAGSEASRHAELTHLLPSSRAGTPTSVFRGESFGSDEAV